MLKSSNQFDRLCMFGQDLSLLKLSQSLETHIKNGLGLNLTQPKPRPSARGGH